VHNAPKSKVASSPARPQRGCNDKKVAAKYKEESSEDDGENYFATSSEDKKTKYNQKQKYKTRKEESSEDDEHSRNTKKNKTGTEYTYEFLTMVQELKRTNEILVTKMDTLSKRVEETSGYASIGKKPFSGDRENAIQESVAPMSGKLKEEEEVTVLLSNTANNEDASEHKSSTSEDGDNHDQDIHDFATADSEKQVTNKDSEDSEDEEDPFEQLDDVTLEQVLQRAMSENDKQLVKKLMAIQDAREENSGQS
jgi:hypothetical protein